MSTVENVDNFYVNILQQRPVFAAMGYAARGQLRRLCKILHQRVTLSMEGHRAQKVLRRAWNRLRLFRALCVSSPHATPEHWIFTDCVERLKRENAGLHNALVCQFALLNQPCEKSAWTRLVCAFRNRLAAATLPIDAPLTMVEFIDYSPPVNFSESRIWIYRRGDSLRFTYIEMMGGSDRIVELEVGGAIWLKQHIPDDAQAIRFNWKNFPIAKLFYQTVFLHFRNFQHYRVLKTRAVWDTEVRSIIMQLSLQEILRGSIILEAILHDGTTKPLSEVDYLFKNGAALSISTRDFIEKLS